GLDVLLYCGYVLAGLSVVLALVTWLASSADLFRIVSGFEVDASIWVRSVPSPTDLVFLLQFLVATTMMNLDYPLHYVASMSRFQWAMFSFYTSWLSDALTDYRGLVVTTTESGAAEFATASGSAPQDLGLYESGLAQYAKLLGIVPPDLF